MWVAIASKYAEGLVISLSALIWLALALLFLQALWRFHIIDYIMNTVLIMTVFKIPLGVRFCASRLSTYKYVPFEVGSVHK